MNNKQTTDGQWPREVDSSTEAESLPVELQNALGAKLRDVYGRLVHEPLPDRFTKLLEQLSKSGKPESNS